MRAARRWLARVGAAGACLLALASPAHAQGSFLRSLDAPTANSTVTEPFTISGWAFWTGATGGASGVDAVHVYGCLASSCGTPVFWGAATTGLARPDVAASFNNPAGASSGYAFAMAGLAPGVYTATVYARQASTGGWYASSVTFTVTSTPEVVIDAPTMNQAVAQPFAFQGWAIDASAPTGTGEDAVNAWAYHNFGNGTPPYVMGAATYGVARPDVAALRGAEPRDRVSAWIEETRSLRN